MPSHKRFQSKARDYSVQPKPSKATKTAKSTDKPSQPGPTTDLKSLPSPQELASQQKLLSIFESAFDEVITSPDFSQTLQEVKSALFDRDFERAFGREDYLDVYAARWSPTRALGYAAVLETLREQLGSLVREDRAETGTAGIAAADGNVADETPNGTAEQFGSLSLSEPEGVLDGTLDDQGAGAASEETGKVISSKSDQPITIPACKTLKLLALGGGAAELVAVASFLSMSPNTTGEVILVDTGPWENTVSRLQTSLATPPPLSKYASAAAKATNPALITPSQLRYTFLQQDILALPPGELRGMLGSKPLCVTLLFTLNELYTSGGMGKTTSFLRSLSREIPADSLLLVVDSPGSYSEAAVGKGGENVERKKYPMSWLLDHTLLRIGEKTRRQKSENGGAVGETSTEGNDKEGGEEQGCKWEKLEENDSVWFRIGDNLRYPIQLENMRYQIHLYRAISLAQS